MSTLKTEIETIELTKETIESMIHCVRGKKVMLDYDLARIYGYETKRFNEQVKNNIEKFPEDFMFRLSTDELEIVLGSEKSAELEQSLWSKKSSLNKSGNLRGRHSKYLPHAFTEQGVYMLMTVLKGKLAVNQSIALIRLFTNLKDYVIENKTLLLNTNDYLETKFSSYDKRFEIIENKLEMVMDNFIDPSTYKHFLILDGQRIEADVAYQSIYSLANRYITIIDDYIDVKTLELLKSVKKEVEIIIVTDNKAKNKITRILMDDFIKDTNYKLKIIQNNNRFHDRYIVVDFQQENEKIYHCGASSKDAGKRITTIMMIDCFDSYHSLIEKTLNNEELIIS